MDPQAALESLRPELDNLLDESVRLPDLPMAVALQEANDLATAISDGLSEELLRVGLNAESLETLPKVIAATRHAQSLWVVARDRSKGEAQAAREAKGAALRSDLLSSCRWNLRQNRVAQGTLSAIAEGEGVADLVQDLHDLAALIDRHRDAFSMDETFDAPAQAEEARSLASEIEAGSSREKVTSDQADAKNLRDRAFTVLDDLVGNIRDAGRYAFRADAKRQRVFSSAYGRRRSAAYRSRRRSESSISEVE